MCIWHRNGSSCCSCESLASYQWRCDDVLLPLVDIWEVFCVSLLLSVVRNVVLNHVRTAVGLGSISSRFGSSVVYPSPNERLLGQLRERGLTKLLEFEPEARADCQNSKQAENNSGLVLEVKLRLRCRIKHRCSANCTLFSIFSKTFSSAAVLHRKWRFK